MPEKLVTWIDKHLIAFLVSVLVLRTGFLFYSGLALVGDESYYWDWSRHPDWCYYSKPPMVAWLIGAMTWVFGDYTAILRLPAVLLGTVFLWFFHATAQAFYGRKAAALALLLILATPGNVLANLIMTIDPPLYCFWIMTLYYLRRAIFDQQIRAWFWAGCATAAGLLSKQVAIALPLMLLIFILLDRRRYQWLKREFLSYLLPIIIAAIPILLWNQQHDWVMFDHSKEHFTHQGATSIIDSFKNVKNLIFYQLLLISPLIFIAVFIASLQAVTGFNRLPADQQFLVLMGPAMLLGVVILSFMQKVQGNWPMPFYFTALILLSGQWQQGRWERLFDYGLKIGLLMVSVTYLLPTLLLVFNLQNTRFDPTKRFNHWPEVADNVQAERMLALPGLENTFIVAYGHRNLASMLAFYLPDHPRVFRFESSGEIKTQYELWNGPEDFAGGNAFIASDTMLIPKQIQTAFINFRFLKQIPNPMHPESPFFLFVGEQLTHWPAPSHQPVPME